MLNKANMNWTTKQISKMVENGKLVFDNVIQRSYVWEKSRKSGLIHSIIEGYPVPPFYARRVDGKIYDFLDGKQRINAIVSFLADSYELAGIDEVEMENGELIDINGKKFSELPEELQDRIKDYGLTIYYYDDISEEETRTLFKKLNNGKPLSSKEKNIANCVDIATISDIGKHEIFTKILNEKGIEARKHLPIIMKLYMILTQDIINVSFESKTFNEIVSTAYLTNAERETIISVLDKAEAVYAIVEKKCKKAAIKMRNETHFVSLAPFFKLAIEDGVSDELMADLIAENFGGSVVVSDNYIEAATKGSAKPSNIVTRNDELTEAWEKFFEVEEA